MTYTSLCYNTLRLERSNLNLLKMYYSLIGNNTGKEHLKNKEILESRISIREDITLELKGYLNTLREHKRNTVLALSPLVKLEYLLVAASRKASWENCEDCELSNVSLYYDCLYGSGSCKDFTDLILTQKGRIENYLIAQM